MKCSIWTESYFPVLTRPKCWGNSSNVWEDVFCVLSRIWLWYNSTRLGLKCQRVFAGKNFVQSYFRYQTEVWSSQHISLRFGDTGCTVSSSSYLWRGIWKLSSLVFVFYRAFHCSAVLALLFSFSLSEYIIQLPDKSNNFPMASLFNFIKLCAVMSLETLNWLTFHGRLPKSWVKSLLIFTGNLAASCHLFL